jgi:hypothetical protein
LLTKNGPYNAQKINRSRNRQTETAFQNFETPFLPSEVPLLKPEVGPTAPDFNIEKLKALKCATAELQKIRHVKNAIIHTIHSTLT